MDGWSDVHTLRAHVYMFSQTLETVFQHPLKKTHRTFKPFLERAGVYTLRGAADVKKKTVLNVQPNVYKSF